MTVALLTVLLRMAPLALCWGTSVAGTGETIPMQTLSCYNDYTSRLVCSWADTEEAQRLINVTLYRRVDSDPRQPVSCNISEDMPWTNCPSSHCVPRKCVIPYQLFVLADNDYYSFQPDRPLGTQLTVTLSQHVQPPPPEDLLITATGDHFRLSWRSALESAQMHWLSQGDLEFEVAYRWIQDSWEDATTILYSAPEAILKDLRPSSTYVARVRARLAPGSRLSGRPSPWSPEVRWASQPGDEAQPQNLLCFFDGLRTLSCSWEVRAQVTSSVSFGLFYRSGPGAGEKECSPVLKEELGGLYTRLRCHIPVPDPGAHGQFNVSVRPRREEKFIKSSEHIQMPAPRLNVTKEVDSYSLHWETEKMYYTHIGRTFEVQYRSEAAAWEDSKTETLQHAHSMVLPKLEPSTTYWARVRVKPTRGAYAGIWSEWSEERSWTTDAKLPAWGLVLILVFVTLALLLALRFCCVYGYRLNRKWKEKIPSPSKSHLFQDGGPGLLLPAGALAFPDLSAHPPASWGRLLPELQGMSSDVGEDLSPLTTEDPKVVCDPPPGPDATPAASGLPTEPPSSAQSDPPAPSGRPGARTPSFDFNGPYLGPPLSRSLPDIAGQLAPPQRAGSPNPAQSGSLEYLCLPPGGQVQLVPLAQVMGQGQTMDMESQPSPGTQGSPSLEPGGDPALSASGLRVGETGQEHSPVALTMSSGDPVRSSGYITTADLVLTLPTGTPSASLALPLGPPPDQNPSLCPRLPGGPPGAPAPRQPGFEGYVELPPTTGLSPETPLVIPAPAAPSSPVLSPGEPREDVPPASPLSEGLLVLQQVGDYCFLPGVGPGPLSPRSKPSSPGPSPEVQDPDKALPVKKPPCQSAPHVPAIQLFKSLKQQDYLSLPPWDIHRPGEVC